MNLKFEWDETKNAANIAKHGVSFQEAVVVFKDPKRVERYDIKHSIFEDRWITVGYCAATLLTIIFTERDDVIRIISARRSKKKDKERYFYGYDKIYFN